MVRQVFPQLKDFWKQDLMFWMASPVESMAQSVEAVQKINFGSLQTKSLDQMSLKIMFNSKSVNILGPFWSLFTSFL